MITITRLHRPYGLVMEGHAGAELNENDHDLVCCAASTLMQTLLYSLSRQGHVIDHEMREGHMLIRCHDAYNCDRQMANTFMVVEDGLEMLAQEWPEHVKFSAENAGMRL